MKLKLNSLVSHQRYVWRKDQGQAFDDKNTLQTVKHVGGSVMLWSCMAVSGTDNVVKTEGRIHSKHQQILRSKTRGWAFQQDTRLYKKCLEALISAKVGLLSSRLLEM